MTMTRTESPDVTQSAAPLSAGRRFWTWSAQHPTVFPLALIVLTCLVVGAINTDFWQLANLFDILRASVVRGLFALGVLVVLASGGLDVSFTAVAALVMYTLTLFVVNVAPDLGMAPILALAALAGAGLGAINGLLVNALKAPALIVTIGTQYAFRGFLLTFVGTALFMNIPAAMDGFGRLTLISVTTERGLAVELPAYFLVLVVAALVTWWMLNFTMIGTGDLCRGRQTGHRRAAGLQGWPGARLRLCLRGASGGSGGRDPRHREPAGQPLRPCRKRAAGDRRRCAGRCPHHRRLGQRAGHLAGRAADHTGQQRADPRRDPQQLADRDPWGLHPCGGAVLRPSRQGARHLTVTDGPGGRTGGRSSSPSIPPESLHT
ncbi:ABC transporter permease [Ponticoccus litoralis]|uniref:ABC transporter permease n=1 Tax=Ponticoccus litoralis TaxID=422297 RepID=A0AAW9SVY3_9RHOB